MIRASLATAARWVGGELVGGDADFAGVGTDSRTVAPGQLFVALRGERFDAHAFVGDALAHGAIGALVERPLTQHAIRQIVAPDSLKALGDLARAWRGALSARIVGITGSNGKTTTRSLVQAVLAVAGRTGGSGGNLNNEVGLPLSVLALDPALDYAVLEMGCGKPGDIAYLAAIGRPQVAIVTNVGPAHLERMGSLGTIADTKAEIYDALPADGIGIVNADDPFAPRFRERLGGRPRIEFGFGADADVGAEALELRGDGSRFLLRLPGSPPAAVELPLPGRHNVANALAAAAAGHALGLDVARIVAGLESAPRVAGRLDPIAVGGGVVYDDSYNANPASVKAGIDTLVLEPGRHWLVLGDMRELGPAERALHAEIGAYARARGIERLLATGTLSAAAVEAFGHGATCYPDRAALAAALAAGLGPGIRVLVKGSRGSAMDDVVSRVLSAHGIRHVGGKSHAV
jgi:UDP-N-acetylmuramoyl-tripeptide--D-alanyl-D-alanine ligase